MPLLLKFGEIQITQEIAQISKSIEVYKMHGSEIFESLNLNITAKLKLYPIKIHIPKLGPQAVTVIIFSTSIELYWVVSISSDMILWYMWIVKAVTPQCKLYETQAWNSLFSEKICVGCALYLKLFDLNYVNFSIKFPVLQS